MNKGALLSLLFVGLITGSYLEFEANLNRAVDVRDSGDTILGPGIGFPQARAISDYLPQLVQGVASKTSAGLPDRLFVPRSAILIRGNGDRRAMLFVYEPNGPAGLAKWRYVNLGEETQTHVEIMSDGPEKGSVEPGEIVLVEGHHYLAHDAPVRLVEDAEAKSRRAAALPARHLPRERESGISILSSARARSNAARGALDRTCSSQYTPS
jgi:hypothetical protein